MPMSSAGFETSAYVPSELNLASYIIWATRASSAEFEKTKSLYIVDHRRRSTWLTRIAVDVPAQVHREGMPTHYVPKRLCMNVGCPRCDDQRGGFRFPWLGDWTCRNGVGNPNEDSLTTRQRWLDCADPLCPIPEHNRRGCVSCVETII